jgi:hypothetical protein
MQELARTATPAAIKALVDALNSPRERVSAAVALLDRGWGKPAQHIGGDTEGPPLHIEFTWADAAPALSAPEPAATDEVDDTKGSISVVFGDTSIGEC